MMGASYSQQDVPIFFVGCKKFIMGYKVILLTVQANCVTKKTPETLEVFPKETFTSEMFASLMVVLQSSKSLDLCLDTLTFIFYDQPI